MRGRIVRPAVLRAVGLVRVSKVGARGEDLLSPDLQRSAIQAYADARGMVVVEWVEALDESGSQARSPWWRRFDQVVGSVEDGEVDAVLVWKFSRAARHRKKWAVALDRVESAGGVLESATEQVDTTTSTGRLARGMLAELAAWEAEVKGEQWREVHASRLARGLPASGRRRFGYSYSKATGFEPDDVEGPWLRVMYERFVQGDTPVTIANWLHSRGVRTTGGAVWQPNHLLTVLDSGFGAGVIRHKGQEFPGAHEPVIDAALWASYRRVRETTRRQAPRTRAATHPVAGLVRCGVCGGPCCRTSRGKAGGVVFVCCLRKVVSSACTGATVAEWRVHEAVKVFLTGVASELDARAGVLAEQKVRAGQVRVAGGRAAREVDQLEVALGRLASEAAQGLLPQSAYVLAREELVTALRAAEERVRVAEEDAAMLAVPAQSTARSVLGSWDELALHDPKGLRDVLAALVARIEVHKGGTTRLSEVRVVPRWEG